MSVILTTAKEEESHISHSEFPAFPLRASKLKVRCTNFRSCLDFISNLVESHFLSRFIL